MTTTPSPRTRSWPITVVGALLAIVFGYMAVAAWFITYEKPLLFEPAIRAITCLVFLVVAYLQLRVALRGHTALSIRNLVRDLLSGGL